MPVAVVTSASAALTPHPFDVDRDRDRDGIVYVRCPAVGLMLRLGHDDAEQLLEALTAAMTADREDTRP